MTNPLKDDEGLPHREPGESPTAYLDRIGRVPPGEPPYDHLCNGSDDNASRREGMLRRHVQNRGRM